MWTYYLEVQTAERLTYQEILAWSQLTCKELEPFEVDILKRIDNIKIKVEQEHAR